MLYNLPIQFRPKQLDAFRALQAEEYGDDDLPINDILGYGGALGGGKSYYIDSACVLRKLLYANSVGAIFRLKKDDVYDTHVVRMFKEWPWIEDFYYPSDWEFRFSNKSRIIVGFAQYPGDEQRYKSHEFDDLYVDQAEEFASSQLKYLTTRNRKSGTQSMQKVPKSMFAFNWGGPGHEYLRRVFYERKHYLPGERKESFHFTHAHLWDNYQWIADLPKKVAKPIKSYYLMPEDDRRDFAIKYAGYANKLKSLDPFMVKALLYGDPDSFIGQFFTKWSENVHVIPPFEIPKHWQRIAAMDYGTQTAVVAGAVDENGIIYITDEYYSDDASLGPKERARKIADWMVEVGLAKREKAFSGDETEKLSWHIPFLADINLWYPDSSNARRMPAADFHDAGLHPRKVLGKQEDGRYRIICNEMMKSLLYWEEGDDNTVARKPKFFVFENCAPEFCRTIPMLIVNPDKPLDFVQPKSSKKDHVYDAVKYLCMNISKASGGLDVTKQIVSSRARAGGAFAIKPSTKFNYAR